MVAMTISRVRGPRVREVSRVLRTSYTENHRGHTTTRLRQIATGNETTGCGGGHGRGHPALQYRQPVPLAASREGAYKIRLRVEELRSATDRRGRRLASPGAASIGCRRGRPTRCPRGRGRPILCPRGCLPDRDCGARPLAARMVDAASGQCLADGAFPEDGWFPSAGRTRASFFGMGTGWVAASFRGRGRAG